MSMLFGSRMDATIAYRICLQPEGQLKPDIITNDGVLLWCLYDRIYRVYSVLP